MIKLLASDLGMHEAMPWIQDLGISSRRFRIAYTLHALGDPGTGDTGAAPFREPASCIHDQDHDHDRDMAEPTIQSSSFLWHRIGILPIVDFISTSQ